MEEHVKSIRPGFRESLKELSNILGLRSNQDLERGIPFSISNIQEIT